MTLKLTWLFLALGAGCSAKESGLDEPQTSSTSASTAVTPSTPTTTLSSTTTTSTTTTTPSTTEPSVHDSGSRSNPTLDTGRSDTGWFTLPGPGFDSASATDFVDSQDTG